MLETAVNYMRLSSDNYDKSQRRRGTITLPPGFRFRSQVESKFHDHCRQISATAGHSRRITQLILQAITYVAGNIAQEWGEYIGSNVGQY